MEHYAKKNLVRQILQNLTLKQTLKQKPDLVDFDYYYYYYFFVCLFVCLFVLEVLVWNTGIS